MTNDRYLFRGFHKVENGTETICLNGEEIKGKWVYGFPYIHNGINGETAYIRNDNILDTKVIPETVGQYTGLNDKKGKKIFDGDIILIGEKRRKVEVIFLNGQFGYLYKTTCISFQYQSPEVIGTIFDKEVK